MQIPNRIYGEQKYMNILFKGIRLIDPVTSFDEITNLHIVNGIIRQISTNDITVTDKTEVIDSRKFVAAPGFIDIHCHFREPGFTHKETLQTGAMAAANGGFTEVVCMPNTNPTIDNLIIVEYIKNKSKDLPVTIYPAASITKERKGESLSPMLELDEAGAIYFTDDGSCVSSAEVMRRAFEYAAPKDLLLAQHCEEHLLTKDFAMNEGYISMKLGLKGYPRIAEEIIINRDIKLAEYLGNRRYHIQHISTSGAVKTIRNAKVTGARVSCEVTPHHLWFSDDNLKTFDTNYKMNPPLRTDSDIAALLYGLRDKTIDCIVSDHAPHSVEECEVEFENAPTGIVGLETQIGAILTLLHYKQRFELKEIINLFAINPRTIIGLPQVEIKEGAKANLTIFSPSERWTVDKDKFLSKGRNTPFAGIKFIGKPKFIINNNQFIKSEL